VAEGQLSDDGDGVDGVAGVTPWDEGGGLRLVLMVSLLVVVEDLAEVM
jgi:hypothetical protein